MVFERKLPLGRVDDVVGHLLVAAEVVARKFLSLAVNLHIGRRVDAVGTLILEE